MTHYAYLVIADSVPLRTKRFRVVYQGWKPEKNKMQTITPTLGSGLDVAAGSSYKSAQYLIRVRHTEPDPNYGSQEDLDYFYSLANPFPTSGSPSNLLTFIDHYGVTLHGYTDGPLTPEPMSVDIEGVNAWFTIPCIFRFTTE